MEIEEYDTNVDLAMLESLYEKQRRECQQAKEAYLNAYERLRYFEGRIVKLKHK